MKDSARVIILLRLTTDGQQASRGLSTTAELLLIRNEQVNDAMSLYSRSSHCRFQKRYNNSSPFHCTVLMQRRQRFSGSFNQII